MGAKDKGLRFSPSLGRNSLEAMGGKGEVVFNTAVADPTPQDLDGKGRRPLVMMSVTDQGPGIPAGAEERIFEPFFTTKNKKGGTGLGLAVSKAIIEAHGGFIRLADSPGKGSVFEVYLPAAE